MHSGLTPLITHAASTDHTHILYTETFAHNVLTHTSTHADTHALNAMHHYGTGTYLWVNILHTRELINRQRK